MCCYVYVGMHVSVCHGVCVVVRGKQSSFSFFIIGFGDQTEVVRPIQKAPLPSEAAQQCSFLLSPLLQSIYRHRSSFRACVVCTCNLCLLYIKLLFSFWLHTHSNTCEGKPSSSESADHTSEIPELTKPLHLSSITARILPAPILLSSAAILRHVRTKY